MCGIFGHIANPDRCSALSSDFLHFVQKRLERRGPDAQNFLEDQNAIFFHTRLSFFDLTSRSDQPIVTESGRYIITFNGEIYNYAEILNKYKILPQISDTLMFAQLLEKDVCIYEIARALDGMFAVSIYDTTQKKLYLIRDRFGEKPLYYTMFGGSTTFCSDALVLAKLINADLNKDAAIDFIKYGFYPPHSQIYNEILSVQPATIVTLQIDTPPTVIKYINEAKIELPYSNYENVNDIFRKFESALMKSVESRLLADTDIGIFLSGGVDSSLIAAAAARIGKVLPAFSIDISGGRSEKDNIVKLQNNIGLDVNYVEVTGDSFLENFEHLIYNFDVPFCDTSGVLYSILCKYTKGQIKGVLSGDGGDEILWGYPHMLTLKKIERYSLRVLQNEWIKSKLIGSKFYKLTGKNIAEKIDRYYDFTRGIISNNTFAFDAPKELTNIDLYNYMPMNCLKKVDNASMAYGLEVRAPFLSNDFFKFNKTLSGYHYNNLFLGKKLQRQTLKKWVGEDTTYEGKRGFSFKVMMDQELMINFVEKDSRRLIENLDISSKEVSKLYTNKSQNQVFRWRLHCLRRFMDVHNLQVS